MGPADRPLLPWLTPEMLSSQSATLIWGNHRTAINRAAWELAVRVSDGYQWLQVGDPDESLDPDDPVAYGLVPPENLFRTVPPEEMAHDRSVANLAMWTVGREGHPNSPHHPLVDFLRIPAVAQELLGSSVGSRGQPVCVVANADRITPYYPDDPPATAANLAVWKREGMSVIATFLDEEREGRFVYDYSFALRVPPGHGWSNATITCEKERENRGRRVGVPVAAFEERLRPAGSA